MWRKGVMTNNDIGQSREEIRAALASAIGRRTAGSEDRSTAIPELSLFRRQTPTPPGICRVEPSVVLTVQGKKRMLVGEDAYAYDSKRFLIASHDIPASSEVVEASPDRPCLGLVLRLDVRMLVELVSQTPLPPQKDRSVASGMALGTVTPTLLKSFQRLLDLLDEPGAVGVLAPLVLREIHFRLLTSDQAGRLRQLASVGSQSHLVTRAIEWLKANYASPLRVEELAALVHMSASSLHHHFRQLTSMSPLQYQKSESRRPRPRLQAPPHLHPRQHPRPPGTAPFPWMGWLPMPPRGPTRPGSSNGALWSPGRGHPDPVLRHMPFGHPYHQRGLGQNPIPPDHGT